MKYRLYNFGLCCRNLNKSIYFYEELGCKVIKKVDQTDYKVAWLFAGSQVIIELNEIPLIIEEKYFTKRRGSINSISFKVDDIYEAYKDIEQKGLRIVWTPKENKGVYQFGLLDEEGMLIKIFNYLDNQPQNEEYIADLNIKLKNNCFLTNQYEKNLHLYQDVLGLCNFNSNTAGGFRTSFLGNADDTDKKTGIFIKEIPEDINDALYTDCFYDREREYIAKYGNGYEHLCFEVIRNNNHKQEWLKDPDGNNVQLIYNNNG